MAACTSATRPRLRHTTSARSKGIACRLASSLTVGKTSCFARRRSAGRKNAAPFASLPLPRRSGLLRHPRPEERQPANGTAGASSTPDRRDDSLRSVFRPLAFGRPLRLAAQDVFPTGSGRTPSRDASPGRLAAHDAEKCGEASLPRRSGGPSSLMDEPDCRSSVTRALDEPGPSRRT